MSVLTKSNIFSLVDLPQKTVKVPEWKGEVIIRAMDGKARDEWDRFTSRRQLEAMERKDVVIDNDSMKATLLVLSCIDEEGNLLFTKEDMDKLQDKNGQVIDRLADVAGALSGIRSIDAEDAEKN